MADKQARITIGIDGVDQVTAAADRVRTAWEGVGSRIGSTVGGAVASVATSMASLGQTAIHVATALNTIDLRSAVEGARAFNEALGRTAVVTGESVAALSGRFESISKAVLVGEPELQKLSRSLGKVTYDFGSAIDAQKGLGQEAIAVGRSADEMQQLGTVLYNALGVTGDVTTALGTLRSQADALGTVGGPAALYDQIARLGGVLNQFAAGDGSRNRLTAFVGALGQGLSPQLAEQTQSSVLGAISGRAVDISRTLGHDILNEQGLVSDPAKVIEDLRKSMERRGLSQRQQLLAWRRLLGNVAGSQVFRGDFSGLGGLADVAPSTGAADATAAFAGSDAGQRVARQLGNERDQRAAAVPLLDAQDSWDSFFQGHPFAKLLAAQMLAGVASSVLKGGASALGGALTGGGAAALGGTAAAGSAGALGAVGESLAVASTAAGPAAIALAGVAAQLKVLTEIGEDTDTTGRKWREAHADVIAAEEENIGSPAERRRKRFQNRADTIDKLLGIGKRWRKGGGEGENAVGFADYLAGADRGLFDQTSKDKNLQEIVVALKEGKIPEDLPDQIAQKLAEALQQNPPVRVENDEQNPVRVTKGKKGELSWQAAIRGGSGRGRN